MLDLKCKKGMSLIENMIAFSLIGVISYLVVTTAKDRNKTLSQQTQLMDVVKVDSAIGYYLRDKITCEQSLKDEIVDSGSSLNSIKDESGANVYSLDEDIDDSISIESILLEQIESYSFSYIDSNIEGFINVKIKYKVIDKFNPSFVKYKTKIHPIYGTFIENNGKFQIDSCSDYQSKLDLISEEAICESIGGTFRTGFCPKEACFPKCYYVLGQDQGANDSTFSSSGSEGKCQNSGGIWDISNETCILDSFCGSKTTCEEDCSGEWIEDEATCNYE